MIKIQQSEYDFEIKLKTGVRKSTKLVVGGKTKYTQTYKALNAYTN